MTFNEKISGLYHSNSPSSLHFYFCFCFTANIKHGLINCDKVVKFTTAVTTILNKTPTHLFNRCSVKSLIAVVTRNRRKIPEKVNVTFLPQQLKKRTLK